MKKLIYFMLVLLGVGFMSCDKEEEHTPYYVMYFTARVVDEAGEPIQGILANPEGYSFYGRSGYSNYKGEIEAYLQMRPEFSGNFIFEDIDGEANGGEYESLTINLIDKVAGLGNKPDDWGFVGSSVVQCGNVVLKLKNN